VQTALLNDKDALQAVVTRLKKVNSVEQKTLTESIAVLEQALQDKSDNALHHAKDSAEISALKASLEKMTIRYNTKPLPVNYKWRNKPTINSP
jgi:hypothetical protein